MGRPFERRLVGELVAAAAAGRGGILLVAGEAGIGKTRLAEEALDEARGRGMGTFVGRCVEGEASLPWLPLVEVLEQLIGRLDDAALRRLLGAGGSEVARLLPALRRRLPDLLPPLDLPAEHARSVLYTALRDLVMRLGSTTPAIVVLEDVHWADPATFSMLEHLADSLEDARILVLATYRADEATLGTALARAVERLTRYRSCTSVLLRPLDAGETADLIAAVTGRIPPPSLSARLWRDADGNPFFVQELLKHLGTQHRLFNEDGLFRADLGSEPLPVPESLRLLLGHRLQRLSKPCRHVLSLAAVIGREVDADLLVAASDEVEDVVVAAIEEALAAGIVRGDQRVSFSHALLRAAVLAELPAVRRRRLHLAAADALIQLYADDSMHAAEIADHLDAAGATADTNTKVRYLELAARRSLESAAYEDAVARLERALASTPPQDSAARARLLAALGYAQRGLGRPDDANAIWLEAVDILERNPGRDVTLAAELCRALGRYLDATGGLEVAIAVIERGLRMVGGDSPHTPHSVERSWLQSALGYALTLQGDLPAAAAAIDAAHLAGDPRLHADVLASRTSLSFATGRLPECVDVADRAAEALTACGQPWDALQATVTTIWPRLWLGRVEEARRTTEATLAAAERLGHVAGMFLARRSEALIDLLTGGDVDRFAAQSDEGVRFCRENRLRWLPDAHVFAGLAELWRGDREQARAHLEAAAACPAPPVYAGRYTAPLLTFYAWEGETYAFDRLLAELRTTFAGRGLTRSIGTVAVTLAEVEGQAVLGRVDQAAAMYGDVMALLDEGIVLRPPDLRIVPALAGLAAGLAGDEATSQTHFAEARRLVASLPHPRERADVGHLEVLASQSR